MQDHVSILVIPSGDGGKLNWSSFHTLLQVKDKEQGKEDNREGRGQAIGKKEKQEGKDNPKPKYVGRTTKDQDQIQKY